MSLTRAEWIKMWGSIEKIEIWTEDLRITRRNLVQKELNKIKEQIQQVIGQME